MQARDRARDGQQGVQALRLDREAEKHCLQLKSLILAALGMHMRNAAADLLLDCDIFWLI
jgi:hypothetical protein